ncbi:gamma-glutamyltranspeptidase family protein [Pseudomonas fluorescens]|uniref:Gamma-glutamyltranspeptidase family protein n=1 Tax=Pseudomonas fluorescens TaxID=294 RepID=A0A0P8ZEC0_PSEFL|nr:gamma-glutamyltranspeptidase family protein [Pseudomonas fluorescens]
MPPPWPRLPGKTAWWSRPSNLASHLAEDGFVLEQGDVDLLDYATDMFKKDIKDSGSIFLSNGEPMQVGQKLVQKDLSKTGVILYDEMWQTGRQEPFLRGQRSSA